MEYSVSVFFFFFHSAVLFEYLVLLLINVKKQQEETKLHLLRCVTYGCRMRGPRVSVSLFGWLNFINMSVRSSSSDLNIAGHLLTSPFLLTYF